MSDGHAVLIVEDEPLIAEAHAEYVRRVPGFAVAGVVHGGGDALRFVRDHPVDLLLLDFNLPDMHGLEVCRRLRAGRAPCDVIAVTSNRDLAAVRSAVSLGVVQYLLKPFTFSAMRTSSSGTRSTGRSWGRRTNSPRSRNSTAPSPRCVARRGRRCRPV